MNTYNELFTTSNNSGYYAEEATPVTVYECGECGVTVSDIPVHERHHVKIDAMYSYLSKLQEVKP